MDVDEPVISISTVSQAIEEQQQQPPAEGLDMEGQVETPEALELVAPTEVPATVSEENVEAVVQVIAESEQQTEDPVVDQDTAIPESEDAIVQSNTILKPEAIASDMAEPPLAEPSTGDEELRGSDDPTATVAQNDSSNQSPPPAVEIHPQGDEQEGDQDASPSGTDSGGGTPQTHSSMNNLQVLAALNNVLAYRDSRDTFEDETQNEPQDELHDDVLILPDDDADHAEASRPLGSAMSNFTEESALTSLGPLDGVSTSGFDQPFDFPSGSGAQADEKSVAGGPDEEGLADYSVPHSRFAGVYLDRVDRRKLRYYVPSAEVKNPQSLKITIKRPAGWTPRAQPVETTRMDEVYTSSGRKTRRPQKSYYEDMVIIDKRRAALSEKRKGKQRDVGFDISKNGEEPTSRGRKAKSESADYTMPVEEASVQDQDISDADSNAESVSAVQKRQKRGTQEPGRRSRIIPEKAKHAHWDDMDEDEVSLGDFYDGTWLILHFSPDGRYNSAISVRSPA